MRIIKSAYTHLGQYITNNVLNLDNSPVFKHIDMWFQQTEYIGDDGRPAQEHPFTFPALFMDFFVPDSTKTGQLSDTLNTEITFYVACETLSDSHIGSSEINNALHFLEVCSLLHEQIQGYAHTDCGNLTRTSIRPFRTISNLMIYAITYSTTLHDTSPMKKRRDTVDAVIDTEGTINKRPQLPPDTAAEGGTFYDDTFFTQ